MQTFKLVIELGNDAMNTSDDIARALRELADKVDRQDNYNGVVVDDNGNKVGSWAID